MVIENKISNFQKINELFERDRKYKELVREIKSNEKNKHNEIIKISRWVYKNIKKINYDISDDIIDSHPWTIVKRRMGVEDQFSDILSVLFFYGGIDSFFMNDLNVEGHPITLFKLNDDWSLIDPYYGIYFLNDKGEFCNLKEYKFKECIFYHLEFGKLSEKLLVKIFFNKNFTNLEELNNYYYVQFKNIPSSKKINKTSIYERGGRSYVQKPIHRLIYQIKKSLNIIKK
jgi:hypothetical protein